MNEGVGVGVGDGPGTEDQMGRGSEEGTDQLKLRTI